MEKDNELMEPVVSEPWNVVLRMMAVLGSYGVFLYTFKMFDDLNQRKLVGTVECGSVVYSSSGIDTCGVHMAWNDLNCSSIVFCSSGIIYHFDSIFIAQIILIVFHVTSLELTAVAEYSLCAGKISSWRLYIYAPYAIFGLIYAVAWLSFTNVSIEDAQVPMYITMNHTIVSTTAHNLHYDPDRFEALSTAYFLGFFIHILISQMTFIFSHKFNSLERYLRY